MAKENLENNVIILCSTHAEYLVDIIKMGLLNGARSAKQFGDNYTYKKYLRRYNRIEEAYDRIRERA